MQNSRMLLHCDIIVSGEGCSSLKTFSRPEMSLFSNDQHSYSMDETSSCLDLDLDLDLNWDWDFDLDLLMPCPPLDEE